MKTLTFIKVKNIFKEKLSEKKLFKFCSSWIKLIKLEQIKNIIILGTNKNIRLNSYEHSQN